MYDFLVSLDYAAKMLGISRSHMAKLTFLHPSQFTAINTEKGWYLSVEEVQEYATQYEAERREFEWKITNSDAVRLKAIQELMEDM